ncbi:hypothetical protein HCJ76_44140 [Streptomyces sp. MC1]|uniref:hypothetical protein n=1 Tax=Streptomyces sp. MC1 TaxID=295105 RepID=UPI0018CA2007|nr:hypothetical protein [Streptomyces sp. MC1]MBG7704875.1 hypothetical protein [Streptomyces sp. MC1]
MSTAIRSELRPPITAAQAAVRAWEKDPRAGTLTAVRDSLEAFPGNELSDGAFQALDHVARQVSAAISSPETSSVINVHIALHGLSHRGPQEKPEEEPTVAAVVALTAQCWGRFAALGRTEVNKRAWERAYKRGVTVLGVLMAELPNASDMNMHRVTIAVNTFIAAVQRAVGYRAMYEAREALVKVAEDGGLFVIGGRQPVQGMEGRGWSRRIGGFLYRFEATGDRPLEGAPAGMVIATRVDENTGEAEERHALPRYFDGEGLAEYGKHRAAEDDALRRI